MKDPQEAGSTVLQPRQKIKFGNVEVKSSNDGLSFNTKEC